MGEGYGEEIRVMILSLHLDENRTITSLAEEYVVSTNTIGRWIVMCKNVAMNNRSILARGSKPIMKYTVVINKHTKGKPYYFSYGNTRDIELIINKNGSSISKEMPKDYTSDFPNNYLGNLIKEGIKRIALVYILRFGHEFKITSIQLEISGIGIAHNVVDITNCLEFSSMIQEQLIKGIPEKWKNKDVLSEVLQYQKSKEEGARKMASLYAYILSKTKRFETERFNYLWMAINGMYGQMTYQQNLNERQQREFLLRHYQLGNTVPCKSDNDRLGRLIQFNLPHDDERFTRDSMEFGCHADFREYVRSELQKRGYEIEPYGFMILGFSYYIRCRMLHANCHIELFSFKNDYEIKSMKIVNDLLEEFLDEHLIELFEED